MKESVLKIVSSYIQLLNSGGVKEGLCEATPAEVKFGTALLQAIAADIIMLES